MIKKTLILDSSTDTRFNTCVTCFHQAERIGPGQQHGCHFGLNLYILNIACFYLIWLTLFKTLTMLNCKPIFHVKPTLNQQKQELFHIVCVEQ